MYAIMGVTGQIGSVIGRALLAAEQPIRAVVRDADKAQVWADRGCEIALANIEDTASLTTAFRGVEGVFVLVPPNFDPAPEFPEARAIAAALRTAPNHRRSYSARSPPSTARARLVSRTRNTSVRSSSSGH